jgi:glycosyltransferase involved in cell wall biosynthesis
LGAGFHAVSHAVQADAARRLGIDAGRIVVIGRARNRDRLGLPSPARRAAARASLGVPGDAEVVVTVGRQEPQKAHDVLVRAWEGIAAARPAARLLVAGRPGRDTPEVQRLVGELPDSAAARVALLGHTDAVGDLLAAADVFVLPSRREGQPGALIEAFALGVPAVVSDLPTLRELVTPGVHGELVPVDDPHALAGAVVALLEDPARRAAMGREVHRAFDERFDLDVVVDQMAALYRDTVVLWRSGRATRR